MLNDVMREWDSDTLRHCRDFLQCMVARHACGDGGAAANESIVGINVELKRRRAPLQLHPERAEAQREDLREAGYDPSWSRVLDQLS